MRKIVNFVTYIYVVNFTHYYLKELFKFFRIFAKNNSAKPKRLGFSIRKCQKIRKSLKFCEFFPDGSTSSPTVYSGEIGKKISGKTGLVRKPMVEFEPVQGIVPEAIDAELLQNQDIRNLFHLCNLVQKGPEAEEKLLKYFKCIPGVVTASRWVTSINNILCHYMQEENPTDNHLLIIKIIVKIYGPLIFNIKMDWHITKAPIHYFNILKYSRELLLHDYPQLFQVVIKVLQNNPYNAHHEALLPCMLFDPEMKDKAVEKIAELREAEKGSKKVRQYQKPNINFNAENYTELLDFKDFNSSPPLLQDFTMDQIQNLEFGEDFKKLACSSQAVERIVFLTSQSGQHAVGYQQRHQWLINKQKHPKKIPHDFTKQHFFDLLPS